MFCVDANLLSALNFEVAVMVHWCMHDNVINSGDDNGVDSDDDNDNDYGRDD